MSVDDLLSERELVMAARDVDVFGVGTSPVRKRVLTVDDAERGLVETGTRIMLARALLADAMLDAGDWTRAADEIGVDRKRIAMLLGLSRPTIYEMLLA